MFKKVLKKSAQKSAQIKKCPKKYSGEDVQVDHDDGDGDGLVFFNTEKVSLKVAVIKETRRLLPNFQITYTIAATVILNFLENCLNLFSLQKKEF